MAMKPAITVNTPSATIHPAFFAAFGAQLPIASLNSPMTSLLLETEPLPNAIGGYFFAAFSTLIASASV